MASTTANLLENVLFILTKLLDFYNLSVGGEDGGGEKGGGLVGVEFGLFVAGADVGEHQLLGAGLEGQRGGLARGAVEFLGGDGRDGGTFRRGTDRPGLPEGNESPLSRSPGRLLRGAEVPVGPCGGTGRRPEPDRPSFHSSA